ncbi:hypothetical protein BSZ39_03210 [Bowdeniella nasicola]|uniref:ABC transporter domain-containing protein n=1 Tax=Bowdeniella nasicola TaxID=208480 RepID=A0A1Q5Q4B2_9ACTO|nr:ABC transporter ATP-binding protein [Bowdeniella nasicola]OKL54621.1 hypothetical protein BSZ39_03210 [Bowdeniella nasicola]
MDTTALALSGVTKSFGDTKAVAGIDIAIKRGEIVALLGPNGSGKTTSLDIALGLTSPDSGSAKLFGADPIAAINRNLVGVMLQANSLPTDDRVGRIITLLARIAGASGTVDSLVKRTEIDGLLTRHVAQLSGGELQRVRLAIALIGDPELLILDEPTAGMDPNARRNFWRLMRREADAGRTIIFATHQLNEAEMFAPRTIVLSHGSVVADGPTAEVRGLTASQHLTALIDEENWPTLHDQLADALAEDDSVDFARGQLAITGADLKDVAIAVLSSPDTHAVELRNSTLDDSFEMLTTTPDAERVTA